MATLQDFLTLIATAIEYFFLAYLAVALMVYSLKPLDAVQPLKIEQQTATAAVSQSYWERSVHPSTSLAGLTG